MVFAVDQVNLEIDDREADQRPRFGGLAKSLLDRRNIFLGNVAALDLVEELEARSAFAGSDVDLDLAGLARPPRLLFGRISQFHRLPEILAIGDLRGADVGLDLEFALHAIDEDLEVELAHPLDDRLTRLMIAGDPE